MMTTLTISNFDAATGELEIREMTLVEQEQYNQDIKRQQDKIKQEVESKAAAQDKLIALGLTSDDLRALGL
jgi:hypothetical protein